MDLYNTDLECYAHQQLPRFKMPKNFYDRADSAYLYLIRQCPYIHTLCIRERISSSTVLLLAYTGKNLRYLNVRRNAIVLKCEWPKSPDWSWDFFKWLRKNSRYVGTCKPGNNLYATTEKASTSKNQAIV